MISKFAFAAPGSVPSVPKTYRKSIDVAEFNQWRWLEEREQWLENVDRTHLVLASGKPVQQKRMSSSGHLDCNI